MWHLRSWISCSYSRSHRRDGYRNIGRLHLAVIRFDVLNHQFCITSYYIHCPQCQTLKNTTTATIFKWEKRGISSTFSAGVYPFNSALHPREFETFVHSWCDTPSSGDLGFNRNLMDRRVMNHSIFFTIFTLSISRVVVRDASSSALRSPSNFVPLFTCFLTVFLEWEWTMKKRCGVWQGSNQGCYCQP